MDTPNHPVSCPGYRPCPDPCDRDARISGPFAPHAGEVIGAFVDNYAGKWIVRRVDHCDRLPVLYRLTLDQLYSGLGPPHRISVDVMRDGRWWPSNMYEIPTQAQEPHP